EGSEGQVEWYFADRCIIHRKGSEPEEWSLHDAEWARWKMAETVIRKLADSSVRVSTAIASRALTALIAEAHRIAEIQPIPARNIDKVPADTGKKGDYIPAIRGLPEALEEAFNQGSTLSIFFKKLSQVHSSK
ncbi:MAG: hypothetical protein KJT03_11580, partial [Verrucomicrobiae bacterium]|nr:hypothetical protein [Verrucomicrobiae bacterium]